MRVIAGFYRVLRIVVVCVYMWIRDYAFKEETKQTMSKSPQCLDIYDDVKAFKRGGNTAKRFITQNKTFFPKILSVQLCSH